MKPTDRQAQITDFVRREGRVSVEKLVAKFKFSPETIRRDLSVISNTGKIQKVHGGAVLPEIFGEGPFRQRMLENVSAKRHIGQKASRLISPGDTLFIDTGSTTLIFAEELTRINNLTIITNSAEVARSIGIDNNSARLFLLGGKYNADNRETCGLMTINQISAFRANHAVLAIGGIDAEAGAMDFNVDEAQVAQAMISQAENTIVLADSTKFNRIASFSVASLNQFNYLVCERQPDGPLKNALIRENIKIIC